MMNKKILNGFLVFLLLAVFQNVCAAKTSDGKLKVYALSNGIPVYVSSMPQNNVDAVFIVVKGGSLLLPPEKSGLESALFSMMKQETAEYSREEIQQLEYKTRSSAVSYSIYCGSVFGVSCLDHYLNDMLPVMLDGFLNPSFSEKEYQLLMKGYSQSIQAMQNTPESLLAYEMNRAVYKGHPLETSSSVTPASIGNITVENMKELHGKILDAKRISVVAVGKMNAKKLLKTLESSLGKIPPKEEVFVEPEIPQLKIEGKPFVMTHKSSAGTGHAYKVFASAPVDSPDYVPSRIAEDMFSQILFNVVRAKYAACYTPQSVISSKPAPYGFTALSRLSEFTHFPEYVKEAEDIMAQGKLVSSYKDGVYEYDSIEDRIEGFRNSYINQKYQNVQTASGIASKYASSLLQFGDIHASDALAVQAAQVSADDVLRVFRKYWLDGNSRYFVITGPDERSRLPF